MRAAIDRHLHALGAEDATRQVVYYNAIRRPPFWLRRSHFDAVILHTTLLCLRWNGNFYNWKWKLRWLRDWRCLKIAVPQDEYDCPEILDEWLYEWGVSVIFTNFDAGHRKMLYPIMHDRAEFHECLTGYINEADAEFYKSRARPVHERDMDIIYRASDLPYWFGSQGQLKHRIAPIVTERAAARGLRTDISVRERDTIVGNQWLNFLASGKCVIGCESGSSVLDRRGEIRAKVMHLLKNDPALSFEEFSARMPDGWDSYRLFAVSPRHFEAIITKTCQILVEGTYNGVLVADKHYIALKRDFSNLDDVLEKVRDHRLLEKIAECAYQDIYINGSYTYQKLADTLQTVLTRRVS